MICDCRRSATCARCLLRRWTRRDLVKRHAEYIERKFVREIIFGVKS